MVLNVICWFLNVVSWALNVVHCAEYTAQSPSCAEPILTHLPQNLQANHEEDQSCIMASNMVCCAECFRSCQLSACAHQRRCIRVFWGVRSLYTCTTYAHGPARPVATGTAGPGSHQPRLAPVAVQPVVTHAHTWHACMCACKLPHKTCTSIHNTCTSFYKTCTSLHKTCTSLHRHAHHFTRHAHHAHHFTRHAHHCARRAYHSTRHAHHFTTHAHHFTRHAHHAHHFTRHAHHFTTHAHYAHRFTRHAHHFARHAQHFTRHAHQSVGCWPGRRGWSTAHCHTCRPLLALCGGTGTHHTAAVY